MRNLIYILLLFVGVCQGQTLQEYEVIRQVQNNIGCASCPTEVRFIMLGNSITQDVFAGTTTVESLIEAEFSGVTAHVFEEGTDGIRAITVDDTIDTLLDGYAAVGYPTYVVITLGTNDVNDWKPYPTASDTQKNNFSAALDTIVASVNSHGFTPILNEIYYMNYATYYNNQELGTAPVNENIVHPKALTVSPDFCFPSGESYYQSYNAFWLNRDTWFLDDLHPSTTGIDGFRDLFVNTICKKIFTDTAPTYIDISTIDTDNDGNPDATDPNTSTAVATNDSFSAVTETASVYDVLVNDDFLPSADVSITDLGTGTAAGTVLFNNLTGDITYTSTAGELSSSVTVNYRVTYVPTGVFADATITINVIAAFDTDAQAYIDANGTLDASQQEAVNNFFVGLKDDLLYSKMYSFYILMNGSATADKWNLVNPLDTDVAHRLTFGGTLTHDVTGTISDGSTGYANTHLSFNTHGTTDFTFGLYSNTSTTTNGGYEMGSNYFGQTVRLNIVESSNHEFLIQGLSLTDALVSSQGLFIGTRTSSTDMRFYKDGTEIASSTTSASPTASAMDTYLFCQNQNNSANNFSNIRMKVAFIAQGLNATEVSNLTTRINTLLANF